MFLVLRGLKKKKKTVHKYLYQHNREIAPCKSCGHFDYMLLLFYFFFSLGDGVIYPLTSDPNSIGLN